MIPLVAESMELQMSEIKHQSLLGTHVFQERPGFSLNEDG